MKRVCAWCRTPMNDEPEDGTPISHGMCDRCAKSVLGALEFPELAVDAGWASTALQTHSMGGTVKEFKGSLRRRVGEQTA